MNGFEEAKARRNWLERLGEKIPGLRGFRDRELRRDVDRKLREQISKEIGELKVRARRAAQAYTDAGKIGELARFDRLDRRLDGLSQAVRFADYGYTGFFDVEKIGEPELERLYAFDLAMLDELESLSDQIAAVPPPGGGDPEEALESALERLGSLEQSWARRRDVIGQAAHPAG
ncbi:MAG: hypothetical protein R3325_14660 [Thermoanaerobaculia bacterium]|nr:hypothetical protein [Thermoanaerobaculia bacterium]